MLTVDARCTHHRCDGQSEMYRMVGSCSNCRQTDILVLITAGHEVVTVPCPKCRNVSVRPNRLATDDEIPVA